MFGKIKKIHSNILTVENLTGKSLSSIVNCHVVFVDEDRKVVGEVLAINEQDADILLVGEIIENVFHAGVIKKPSGNSTVRIINVNELELI